MFVEKENGKDLKNFRAIIKYIGIAFEISKLCAYR